MLKFKDNGRKKTQIEEENNVFKERRDALRVAPEDFTSLAQHIE